MIYKIKDCLLNVESEVSEFDEIIYGRFSQFDKIENAETDNYLKFNTNSVQIRIKEQEKVLNKRVVKTDIYTIVNNVISTIINDEENMYIHSVVVSDSKYGILIIGNFGQGKTTLANEFLKYGYKINSTDQTWLKLDNSQLYQILGSRFYCEDGKIKFLDETNSKEKIKIDKVIRIVGLCDNGDASINEQNNLYYKIKQISDFCNWTNITPVFTEDIVLYDTTIYTKKFLSQLGELRLFNIRGDKEKIVKKIK